MIKHLLSICLLATIVFSGCKVKTEVDPDNAAQIEGTYKMTIYNTKAQNNSNPAAGNNVVITKIDKNTVKAVVVYASSSNTVTLDNVPITASNNVYSLSKTYTNGTAKGNVSGTTLKLNLDYTDGSYAYITAVK